MTNSDHVFNSPCNRTFSICVIFVLVLAIVSMPIMAFAQGSGIGTGGSSRGSGSSSGGGGCSDCFAPTLGVDKNGVIRFVDNGLTINGKSFDVELHFQAIPTQVLYTYKTNEIILKIFEDRGPDNIESVTLSFIDYTVQGGAVLDDSKSSITWTRNSDVVINDQIQMLKNVNANMASNHDDTVSAIFSFQVTQEIEPPALKVQVRDKQNNVWNNYFANAITVKQDSPLISATPPESGSENHVPILPPEQNDMGFPLAAQDVLDFFGMLVQINSERRDVLNVQAMEYVRIAEFNEALEIYDQLLTEYPNDHNVYNDIGYAYLQSGINDKALENFEMGLAIKPDDIRLQNNRIIAIFNLGDYDTALDEVTKTLGQAPQDENALGMKALILVVMERYDEAQVIAEQILETDFRNVDAITTLAILEYEKGNFATAHYYLTIVNEMEPNFFFALLMQSQVANKVQNYEDSLEAFSHAQLLESVEATSISEKALEVKYFQNYNDPFEVLRLVVADNYYNLQEYAIALELVNDILEDNPQHKEALELQEKIIMMSTVEPSKNIEEVKEMLKIILAPITVTLLSVLIYHHVWKKIHKKRIFAVKKENSSSTPTIKTRSKPITKGNTRYIEMMDAVHIIGEVIIIGLTLFVYSGEF